MTKIKKMFHHSSSFQRVGLAQPNEEEPTFVSIPGFLTEWRGRAGVKGQTKSPVKVDMQFLKRHKKQLLALHAELCKVDFCPQSDAGLTNLKTLLLQQKKLARPPPPPPPPPMQQQLLLHPAAVARASPRPMAPPPRRRRMKAATPPPPPYDLPLLPPPNVHIFTTWTPHSWSSVNFDDITMLSR